MRVARALDARCVEWQYEPRRFTLEDRTYCPDFYLPATDEFWEVKGWFKPYSQETDTQFRRLYPHVKLRLVFKTDIAVLERETIQC